MNGIHHDPYGKFHMGSTAENIAERYGITRQMQDELAFESQQRAARAVADGRFASQIVPVELKTRSGTTLFDTDRSEEHTSELQSLMRNSYAVFCLKKTHHIHQRRTHQQIRP